MLGAPRETGAAANRAVEKAAETVPFPEQRFLQPLFSSLRPRVSPSTRPPSSRAFNARDKDQALKSTLLAQWVPCLGIRPTRGGGRQGCSVASGPRRPEEEKQTLVGEGAVPGTPYTGKSGKQ